MASGEAAWFTLVLAADSSSTACPIIAPSYKITSGGSVTRIHTS